MKYEQLRDVFDIYTKNEQLCYLDYAATTFMPRTVLSAWEEYHSTVSIAAGRNKSFLGNEANRTLTQSRERLKKFFHVESEYEFIFTKNATEALNTAAFGMRECLNEGDIILLSALEHHSNLLPWEQVAAQTGAIIVMIPLTEDGGLMYEILDDLALQQVKIVSLSLVSNVTGYQIDTERIQQFVKKVGAFYILDISQAVAHERFDCTIYNADMYMLSAHKMYGPKNIGGLIIKQTLLSMIKPMMYGGGMVWNITGEVKEWADGASKFEAGTFDVGLAFAWSKACDFLEAVTFTEIKNHNKITYDKLKEALSQIEDIIIVKNGQHHTHALLSFDYKKMHSHDLELALSERNIVIRTGHMCSQNTLRELGFVSLNRLSWGIGVTDEVTTKFVNALKEIDEKL